MHVHSRGYRDIRRTLSTQHQDLRLVTFHAYKYAKQGNPQKKPCYTVYKVQLTKNSLRAPLVSRKERSGEKIDEGSLFHCAIVLKKKRRDSRISWNLYRDKTF